MNDLAASEPEKLQELTELCWAQAEQYGVLPFDGRGIVGEGVISNISNMGGPGVFSVGKSALTPVTEDYESPFAFTGELKEVRLTIPQFVRDLDVETAIELAVD